jgi:hypothetical protein
MNPAPIPSAALTPWQPDLRFTHSMKRRLNLRYPEFQNCTETQNEEICPSDSKRSTYFTIRRPLKLSSTVQPCRTGDGIVARRAVSSLSSIYELLINSLTRNCPQLVFHAVQEKFGATSCLANPTVARIVNWMAYFAMYRIEGRLLLDCAVIIHV